MKSSRLHFAAMLCFITGFVCANSGWAPVLAIWASGRPAWSVCGEDLCLCVAPEENSEPGCPLCVSELLNETRCSLSDEPRSKPSTERRPKRVPRNPHEDAITKAGELGCASLYIALAFSVGRGRFDDTRLGSPRYPEPDARLALNDPEIPTPPPRA